MSIDNTLIAAASHRADADDAIYGSDVDDAMNRRAIAAYIAQGWKFRVVETGEKFRTAEALAVRLGCTESGVRNAICTGHYCRGYTIERMPEAKLPPMRCMPWSGTLVGSRWELVKACVAA